MFVVACQNKCHELNVPRMKSSCWIRVHMAGSPDAKQYRPHFGEYDYNQFYDAENLVSCKDGQTGPSSS
jgi:hypothetical protein